MINRELLFNLFLLLINADYIQTYLFIYIDTDNPWYWRGKFHHASIPGNLRQLEPVFISYFSAANLRQFNE